MHRPSFARVVLATALCFSAAPAAAQFSNPHDGYFAGPVDVSRGIYDGYFFSLYVQVETGRSQSSGQFGARVSGQVGKIDFGFVDHIDLFVTTEQPPTLRGLVAGGNPFGCDLSMDQYSHLGVLAQPGQLLPVLTYQLAPAGFCADDDLLAIAADPRAFTATNFLGSYNLYPRDDTGGIDWTLIDAPLAPVPEPATLALTAGGLALVGVFARRRRSGSREV